MNKFFSEINKNFGFGCMRLPMIDKEVDEEQFAIMVDKFLEAGFNYFDTAHVYIEGKSELALKHCLTSRYDRNKFVLANKLSSTCFKTKEEIIPFFNSQLEACGVDYFDFYLMHAQSHNNYQQYVDCQAYKVAYQLKQEGKIKHLGLSFHDKPEFLEKILSENPEVEFVQLQFNYLDFNDSNVQSKACYDVCVKHNKPVVVMEPVKGGSLVNLPDDAQKILTDLNNGSTASYAIRFAAGFENIMMVLSGMSNIEQMDDNLSFMKDFKPLSQQEHEALDKVVGEFEKLRLIKCTGCRYCCDGCPMQINIPRVFDIYNRDHMFKNFAGKERYDELATKPSQCLQCGQCEGQCPQHLPIIDLLQQVVNKYE